MEAILKTVFCVSDGEKPAGALWRHLEMACHEVDSCDKLRAGLRAPQTLSKTGSGRWKKRRAYLSASRMS